MAIIVEDGTAKTDSESYISVADTATYHSNRGNTLWATLSTTEAEQALRRATDYMMQVYRFKWAGVRLTATQALDWPRSFVPIKDFEYAGLNGYTTLGGNYYYDSSVVPQEVKNACAELAFKAAGGELAEDLTQGVIREKVDVVEVEYDKNSPQFKRYRAIDNMLAAYLDGSTSGTFRKVVRV